MRGGKLVLCWFVMLLIATNATAQQFAFQVTFKDKQGGTATLSAPLAYLSQRALDRRSAQGIAVDSTDLPVSPAYIDSVLTLTNGILHIESRWLNLCVILLSDSNQILNLQGKPYITDIRGVGYYSTFLHNKPNAPLFTNPVPQLKTTGSSAYYGDTYPQTILVNGDCLHDQGYKGQGKLIAVLDAGFTEADTHTGFDSLRQSGRLLDVHNFVLATNDVYGYDSHGMSVLSTMAGNEPGTYVGTAPYAMYALYVTEAEGERPIELDNMLAGSERADSMGADVITTSLGYNTFDDPTYNFVYADIDGKTTVAAKAANMATNKGILFVASAGNEGGDSWNYVLTPGDADSALTIGSVDINETPASTSGYGPNAAGQVKPDVCAMGENPYTFYTSNTIINGQSGTSFSTPQIAGWAACLWQAVGTTTPYKLRKAIDESADHYTSPGAQIGYGVPDFCKAQQYLKIQDTPLNNNDWVTVGPNPFTNNVNISVDLNSSQNVSFKLMDVTGKTLFATQQYLYKGMNKNMPLLIAPSLPAGIYFLKVTGATTQKVIKLEKL